MTVGGMGFIPERLLMMMMMTALSSYIWYVFMIYYCLYPSPGRQRRDGLPYLGVSDSTCASRRAACAFMRCMSVATAEAGAEQ